MPENRALFLASEGCELMLRLIREAGYLRHGALRVLSYACLASSDAPAPTAPSAPPAPPAPTTGDDLRASLAAALVQNGALKHIFPAFMGLGLAHTRREHGEGAADAEVEYCVGIVEALLAALPRGGAGSPGLDRLRLVAKFSEDRGAKAQRLVELRRRYDAGVRGCEEAAAAAAAEAARAGAAGEEEAEAEAEVAEAEAAVALAAAQGALQRVDLIIGRLLVEGSVGRADSAGSAGSADSAALRVRSEAAFCLRAKLHEQGVSLVETLQSLSAYAAGLEGTGERERQHVLGMSRELALSWGLDAGAEEGEAEGGAGAGAADA